MYTMVMNFPPIQDQPLSRPRHCPHCGSTILQKWGRATKPLKDIDHQRAEVHRYRCTDCKRTFRTYPPGIERSSRSQRLRALAAFTWAVGLSLDSVVDVFQSLGLEMSRTTVWRDGRQMIGNHRGSHPERLVTLLGIEHQSEDNFGPLGQATHSNGQASPHPSDRRPHFLAGDEITVFLIIGRMYISLGVVDIEGPRAARAWLQNLADEMGMEVNVLLNKRNGRLLN